MIDQNPLYCRDLATRESGDTRIICASCKYMRVESFYTYDRRTPMPECEHGDKREEIKPGSFLCSACANIWRKQAARKRSVECCQCRTKLWNRKPWNGRKAPPVIPDMLHHCKNFESRSQPRSKEDAYDE